MPETQSQGEMVWPNMTLEPEPGQEFVDVRTETDLELLYVDDDRALLVDPDGRARLESRSLFNTYVDRGRLKRASAVADSVDSDDDSVGSDDDSVDSDTDSVDPDTDSVDPDTGSVDPDTGSVDLDADSVDLDADSVDLDADSVDPADVIEHGILEETEQDVAGGTPMVLTEVRGIGVETARALLEAGFESAEDIATTPCEELTTVAGVGQASATALCETAAAVSETRDSVSCRAQAARRAGTATPIVFTSVSGVGAASALALREAGVWSAEAVSETDKETLLALDGIGEQNYTALTSHAAAR